MSQLRLLTLNSAEELLDAAAAWDDLWRRSDVALPTLQAELVALWLRRFARRGGFRALVVEDEGRYVAALPLCRERLKGLLPVAGLTSNPWSICGDLLLDEQSNIKQGIVPAAVDLLVAAAGASPEALLWLEGVDCQTSRWRAWVAAAQRAGLACATRPICDVALIDAQDSWETFVAGLSRDFRRNLRRRARQLEELGKLELRSWSDGGEYLASREEWRVGRGDGSDSAPLLQRGPLLTMRHSPATTTLSGAVRRAFDLEDQSWKGDAGTSVLRTPGMFDFFGEQAALLAARGQLALHFLELDGRPIAFEYGYLAKGAYFAHKVSYLPEYQKAAPGHVLRWYLLPRLFAQPGFHGVDLFGKLTKAAERWMTRRYTLSRLVVCPPRPFSRMLMAPATRWWPRMRRCLGGGNDRAREP